MYNFAALHEEKGGMEKKKWTENGGLAGVVATPC